jgi:hypothetical protein
MKVEMDPHNKAEYENGLKCSWHAKSTVEMSREELIAFIGMLDTWATYLWKQCGEPKRVEKQECCRDRAVRKVSCANCVHRTYKWKCLVVMEKNQCASEICLDHEHWAHDGSGKR